MRLVRLDALRAALTTTLLLALLLALVPALVACAQTHQGTNTDPAQVDSTESPTLGACRSLTPADVAGPSNASEVVPCTRSHTAETYAVGPLPQEFADADYEDSRLGRFAYRTCSKAFMRFLGADESLVLRSTLTWAWFRPSVQAWEDGARWYRCDIVGGGEESQEYAELPSTAKGLLRNRPDAWLVCVNGPSIDGEKIACDQPHTWRAVTTIKLGEPEETYPGDRIVEVRTRDYCSKSVGAWMNYPVDFDYAYTYFHEGEWNAGNRRSICWAQTDQ